MNETVSKVEILSFGDPYPMSPSGGTGGAYDYIQVGDPIYPTPVPAPGRCPGCGRCRTCGQPVPAPYVPQPGPITIIPGPYVNPYPTYPYGPWIVTNQTINVLEDDHAVVCN